MEEKREENVKIIRQWISSGEATVPQNTADSEILMFLHSCYYDIQETQKTMSNYYKIRSTTPEFFTDRALTSPHLNHIQKVVKFCFLPNTTAKGYTILMGKLDNPDPGQFYLDTAMKLSFMHIDSYIRNYPQAEGIIFVFDMKGATFSHFTRCSLSTIKKYLNYLQVAMPIRLKEIRVLNANSTMSHIMTLIKPFVQKKYLQLIKFHKPGEPGDLYETIPKQYFPKDYDGENASFHTLNESSISIINDTLSFFKEEELTLSKLDIKKDKNGKKKDEEIKSFSKLELD